MEHFGKRVIALRQHKGWNRRQLAREACLHEFHLSKVERGERTRVTPDTLIKLARALECSTDYLLGLRDTPQEKIPPPPLHQDSPAV